MRHNFLVKVFYMWISSFPNTISWRDYLFSNVNFWCLCQKSGGSSCVGLSICCFYLCHTVFVTIALYYNLKSGIFWYLCHCSFYSGLLLLLGVFCASKWILGLIFFCSNEKWHWNFDGDYTETIDFNSIDIFTILLLPIHEHANLSIFECFFQCFTVFIAEVFTSLVKLFLGI
jgi:hypothetical protein